MVFWGLKDGDKCQTRKVSALGDGSMFLASSGMSFIAYFNVTPLNCLFSRLGFPSVA